MKNVVRYLDKDGNQIEDENSPEIVRVEVLHLAENGSVEKMEWYDKPGYKPQAREE